MMPADGGRFRGGSVVSAAFDRGGDDGLTAVGLDDLRDDLRAA